MIELFFGGSSVRDEEWCIDRGGGRDSGLGCKRGNIGGGAVMN